MQTSPIDAADNFTYYDLLIKLQALTTEQLGQQVRCINERSNEKALDMWVLEEDHIDPSGEGLEPVSAFPEMSAEELAMEQRWPAGLALIQTA